MIQEYLEKLTGELAFDPSLSRRLRQEVEDHLREAVSADPSGDALDAERRAVANFGDPRFIAAQFGVASLAACARRIGVAAVLVAAGVFALMKARLSWYGMVLLPAPDQAGSLGAVVLAVDRYAFWLAFLAAFAGWTYIESRGVPAGFTKDYRARIRRFAVLSSVGTAALIVSVVSDGVLTLLRLGGTEWTLGLLLPISTMAVEAACAALLVSYIVGMARRVAFVSQLEISGRSR